MKQQIDNLIANSLLDEGEIFLPSVGTLILYRHAAERVSAKRLQPPYSELRFTPEERGVNILLLISKRANVSEERASDIYAEWLAQSLRNNIVTIGGVCSIQNSTITTNDAFERLANPSGRNVVKIKPRTNHFITAFASLCILAALGAAGYFFLYPNYIEQSKEANTQINIAQTIEPVVEATTSEVIVADSVVVEPTTEQTAEVTTVPVTDEIVAQQVEPAIPALQKGKSYGVWGVYTKLKSAEDAIAWLNKKNPEIEARIYIYDDKYMVALCEENTRKACGRKVSAWRKQHKRFQDIWVYTR